MSPAGYYIKLDEVADELIESEQALRHEATKAPTRAGREETLAAADQLSATRRRLRSFAAQAAEAAAQPRGGEIPVRALTDPVRIGSLNIDPRSREVRVDDERVTLANKEYQLLRALASDPTRVFTKTELLRDVWGFRSMGRTRTLDSHASRLRQKLNGAAHRHFVCNVWGVGYRLVDELPVGEEVSA